MTSPDVRSEPSDNTTPSVVVLVLAALMPYVPSLAFGYVLDDTTAIRSNADMNGWSSLIRVWAHPYGGEGSPFFGLYRPLTMMVFAFVWNAGGHWALWFHLLVLLLHAAATLLVHRMLSQVVGRFPAFAGALLFAVHPVHVEAVANIANSSEVIVAIWTCLLALYLAKADDADTALGWRTAAMAAFLYFLALVSKESGAASAPLALLWVWSRRAIRPTAKANVLAMLLRWKRVLVGLAGAAILVAIARALVLGGPVTGESIGTPGLAELSAIDRIRAMFSLGPLIATLLLWPETINPHYGPTTFPANTTLWAAITVAALATIAWYAFRQARKGDRRWLAGVAWVVIAFLPASNLLVATGQILAERTLYVPSIGVALLVAATVSLLWHRSAESVRARTVRAIVGGTVVVLAAVLALRTSGFVATWRDHPTLFAQIIAADSANYRGYWLSGLEARNAGATENALTLLERAHRMYPTDRGLMIDYSESLMHAGQPAKAATVASGLLSSPKQLERPYAVALYLEALNAGYGADSVIRAASRLMRETPNPTAALFLGRAYEARGIRDSAAAAYERGLTLAPRDSVLQMRLQILRAAR